MFVTKKNQVFKWKLMESFIQFHTIALTINKVFFSVHWLKGEHSKAIFLLQIYCNSWWSINLRSIKLYRVYFIKKKKDNSFSRITPLVNKYTAWVRVRWTSPSKRVTRKPLTKKKYRFPRRKSTPSFRKTF